MMLHESLAIEKEINDILLREVRDPSRKVFGMLSKVDDSPYSTELANNQYVNVILQIAQANHVKLLEKEELIFISELAWQLKVHTKPTTMVGCEKNEANDLAKSY